MGPGGDPGIFRWINKRAPGAGAGQGLIFYLAFGWAHSEARNTVSPSLMVSITRRSFSSSGGQKGSRSE